MMDIPENGADIQHFKYVHLYLLPYTNQFQVWWTMNWARGDDPELQQKLFTHKTKYVHDFRQMLYKKYVENYPGKQYLSMAATDSLFKLPFLPPFGQYSFNVFQIGPTLVYIIVRFRTHVTVFVHYHQPTQPYSTKVIHQGYFSSHTPYLVSMATIMAEGRQVTNDTLIWSAKRFGRKLYYKEN